jgi:hypothetical protein
MELIKIMLLYSLKLNHSHHKFQDEARVLPSAMRTAVSGPDSLLNTETARLSTCCRDIYTPSYVYSNHLLPGLFIVALLLRYVLYLFSIYNSERSRIAKCLKNLL